MAAAQGTKHQATGKGSPLKALFLSLLGLFIFFVPVDEGRVPLVMLVTFIKDTLKNANLLPYLAVGISASLMLTLYLGKIKKVPFFKRHHKGDTAFRISFYVAGLILSLMILTKNAPAFILDPEVGGLALYLSAVIFLTVSLAGWLVSIVLNSGVVEFMAVLLEPIMRPLFKLPGDSAVDAMSAFVSSSAVGVFIADQHYLDGRYTRKEGYGVVTNFCVMSIGYMGVISGIGNVSQYYTEIVLTIFASVFVITAIMMRIPPLATLPSTYHDGSTQTAEQRVPKKRENRFQDAVDVAVKQSAFFTLPFFAKSFISALFFGQKIVGFLVSIVVVAMAVYYYTPFFQYIGQPMVPVLEFFNIPDAAKIGAATLIGFIDVTLPAIAVSDPSIAPMAAFFIVALSAVQIISVSEAAIAMVEAHFMVRVWHLLVIFVLRTAIAIPVVAASAHFFF